MSKTNTTPDLAQRIVEYMSRTTHPKASSDGTNDKGFEVIGTVPEHLRHLHNLLFDLSNETIRAETALLKAKKRHSVMRDLFFYSLETHVPDPEDADGVMILANWDVVAMVRDEKGEMRGRLDALLSGLCD